MLISYSSAAAAPALCSTQQLQLLRPHCAQHVQLPLLLHPRCAQHVLPLLQDLLRCLGPATAVRAQNVELLRALLLLLDARPDLPQLAGPRQGALPVLLQALHNLAYLGALPPCSNVVAATFAEVGQAVGGVGRGNEGRGGEGRVQEGGMLATRGVGT